MFVFSVISAVISAIFTLFFIVGYFVLSNSRDIYDEDEKSYWILLVYVLCGAIWFVTSLMLALTYSGVLVVWVHIVLRFVQRGRR